MCSREYDERSEDNRWERDHDRRGGSNFEDKKHSDYNDHGQQRDNNREGSYDWRAPEKDYTEKQSRNYNNRDMDRQSSRESQKEYSDGTRKDYDRKSSDSYDPKNTSDKQAESFDRKNTAPEYDRKSDSYERKSVDKYERRDDRQEPNKQPERPDSRNSRHSRESARDSFKPEVFSDKEFTGSWADAPCENYDTREANYAKINKASGFQEKPHFPEKTESTKNDPNYGSSYRDHRSPKDYKSDSDESKRGNYGKPHMKKSPSNLQKDDVLSPQEQPQLEESRVASPKIVETNVSVPPPRTENSPKAWADSISPITIANENIKNLSLDSIKDDKDADRSIDSKYNDSGKDRVERKLSSSGSEKKSNMGSRTRLDSGGSRRGFVVYRGGNNWQGGRGAPDARRTRGPGRGRSNRDSMYSESEISGDETHHHGSEHKQEDKPRAARSPKGQVKKSDKDDRNRSAGNNANNQGSNENRPFPNESSREGNQRKRHDSRGEGREAFAPRGEPSRRGRGSFRGRGTVHMGYGPGPPSSKSPFGQPNSQSGEADNDPSKADNLSSDEKNKLKQQALSAGIIGRERRGVPPRMQEKNLKSRNRTGGSGEEEAWETTSEHSEGGTKQSKPGNKHQSAKQPERPSQNAKPVITVDKKPGQNTSQQARGTNAPAGRQNSAGSITRSNQPNKKDILPFSSVTSTVNRVDDVKYNDTNAVTNALTDLKISASKGQSVKDIKKPDAPEEEILDDGFQEVRSKKNVKDSRGQLPKEDPLQQNRSQKSQPGKPLEGQRNNSSTRSSSEKSGGSVGGGRVNSGPPNPLKVNGPQSMAPPHDRNMGPPQNSQNKPSQFDRLRQSNLPPRLARQREHNRIQKQIGQGFNPPGPNDLNTVPPSPISAWDKPINQSLRGNLENEQIVNATIIVEPNDMGLAENHSAQSSQRSTPNAITIEQKAPGSLVNMDKSSILDGTTTPVQTIIFENTNYKSAPEALKQKFVSSPVGQQQSPTSNGAPAKVQCGTPKSNMVPINQGSDLDSQILAFANDSTQSVPFISDLISNDQSGVKQDPSSLQLPISFVSKNSEDSSDMKLDFAFDSDLSQLTEDKAAKGLRLPCSIQIMSSPSQNTISTATDQELNMKIASVKKVWDTSIPTGIEQTHVDDSNMNQHNMATQHMSVSSPHSLSSQHSMSAHLMTSQHNMASQHNLGQQLGSPHGMSQHNLVSQHGLSSQHNMSVSSSGQFTTGFEDHQNANDVGQSQGFSPGGGNVNNQTTNVCKVKPTQQALHSASQGMAQSALQNMQATLISQNTGLQGMSQATATALQSMGGGGMQGVGGVMGLSPPPMQHAYNHLNYPPSQYSGISAIPSPPTVVFNSSQQLLNSSQQMPSQGGLYNAFQIDQSRNQFGGFPGGPYGAGSAPYNYQPQDMFQGLQGQYRMV